MFRRVGMVPIRHHTSSRVRINSYMFVYMFLLLQKTHQRKSSTETELYFDRRDSLSDRHGSPLFQLDGR